MLGIVLWVFGDGGSIAEFPEDLERFTGALSSGYFDGNGAMWLAGVPLVAAGVLAMAWGCLPVTAARLRRNSVRRLPRIQQAPRITMNREQSPRF